ncbi:MAG: MFS transporter [Pseudomonadota bacterium]|nr:MFS transporter [Pseudomonadota bacterium]
MAGARRPVAARVLFADRQFSRLWAVGGLGGAMRWLEILVLGIYAYEISGSAFVVSAMLVARMAPMVLFGTVIGALVEGMDRRWVLIGACLLMAGGALAITAASVLNVMSLPLLAAIAFLNGLGWSTDFPVRRTLVGDVVAAEYLGNAMAFDSATNSATRMLGPLIGGAVYQWVGLTGAYAIATGFYLAMILLAVGLTPVAARATAPSAGLLRRLAEGFAYARGSGAIAGVLIITVLLNFFGFAYAAIVPVWAVESFAADPVRVGLLAAAEGAGALCGSVSLAFFARAGAFQRIFLIGATVFVGALLISAKLPIYAVAMAVLFIAGVGISCFGAMQSTIVLNVCEPSYRSRVMGVLAACIGAGPLGVLHIGWLAELTSASTAIAISSAEGLVLMLLVVWRLPGIRR